MLIAFAVGSLFGATILNAFSTLPQPEDVVVFMVIAMSIACILWCTNKQVLQTVRVILLSVIIGFSWAYFQACQKLAWQLPQEHINQSIEILGTVTGVSQWNSRTLRFDILMSHCAGKKLVSPVKARLFWANASVLLANNDKIRCHVKLKPPWHLANPGGFDQEKQFFIEGIRATGKLISLNEYEIGSRRNLTGLRQYLNDRMSNLLVDKPFLGVIQATTLGIYKNITPEQWQVFQATGTSHAIAISGLHVALVAMLCCFVVTAITRRFVLLTSLYPAQCYGAIAAMIGAISYSSIAGFSIPTQRSLIMIMVALLALLKRQPIFSWYSLALSWIVIGMIDPLAPLQMGFWLSFGSVAALIYGGSHVGKQRWQQWVIPQCVAFVGIVPLCVLFFHQVAILSPLANMIALPVINILVVPPSLMALLLMGFSTTLAKFSLWVAHTALLSIWGILEKIAHLSFSIWHFGQVPLLHLILVFCGAFLLLAPKGIPARHLGWLGFLPMIFFQTPSLNEGECRFTLLDVGQGLAGVIQTQHHTLLYDAGPQYGDNHDAGGRVIQPFLLTQQINTLDKVIISHSDLDHRGGLKGLQNWPMGEVITSEPTRLTLSARQCLAGEKWQWDGVDFALLSPFVVEDKKRNNLSCVLKVSAGKQSVLFAGDIEQTTEKKLVEAFPDLLKSTILVVPHHGSLTSSSNEFVSKVSPEYALYSVGLGNRYGFPKAAVIKRYEEVGSKNLIVSQTGAMIFHLNDTEELTPPICWRETSRHYWHI